MALSLSQKDAFLKRIKTLFIDGFVLADLGPEVAAAEAGDAEGTCTAIIIEQAMAFGTLVYDDRRVTLWPASARAATAAALSAFKRKFEIFALFLLLKAISHFILCCKAISYERSTNARSFTR